VNHTTVRELLELATAAEEVAESIYRELEGRFAAVEEVAAFWSEYARDEREHIRVLEEIRDGLDEEQLSQTVRIQALKGLRSLVDTSIAETVGGVKTLEDAFRVATRLESSEVNAVFEFLTAQFSLAQRAEFFVKAGLEEHVAKLRNEFPVGPGRRHTIKAE
jgi:rubrerythrin